MLECLNVADKFGDTPLFNACRVGSVALIQFLVKQVNCERLFVNEITNETPAHIACRMNRLDVLKVILSEGINAPLKCEELNHLNKSLLHLACEGDAEDIVDYLIGDKICEKNSEDVDGRTPLHVAVMRGNFSIARPLLVTKIFEYTDKDRNKNTILHYICTRQLVDSKLRSLFSEYNLKSLIKEQNEHGYTPIHYLCENGGVEVFHFLMEHCCHEEINTALIYANEEAKNSPLHLAVKERRLTMIEYLVECTELATGLSNAITMQNSEGNNVFHLAIKHFKSRVCNSDGTECSKSYAVAIIEEILLKSTLLKESEKVSCLCQKNTEGNTPIQYLITLSGERKLNNESIAVFECLLNSELSRSSKEKILCITSSCGDTLIHLATAKNLVDVVKLLVNAQLCDPTIHNDQRETPLHVACSKCLFDLSQFLCEHECDPHELDHSGRSPLFNALSSEPNFLLQLIQVIHWSPDRKVIKVASEGEKNYHNISGYYKQLMMSQSSLDTPFTLPLTHCMLLRFMNNRVDVLNEVTSILVKYNIPNVTDSLGNTILHLCAVCYIKNCEFLKDVLALEDCEIDHANIEHNTPLHIACANNAISLITLILDSVKCDFLNKENFDKHTPLYYARDRDLINCLILNGAEPKHLFDSARVHEIEQQFEKCKSDNPLNPTLSVLVLGNSLAGKTTLIKLLTEAYKWEQTNPSFGQISEKVERTVGVDMLEYRVQLDDKIRILFYDYAGQTQFHGPHSIHLQNLVSHSQPSERPPLLFLIVVDLTESDRMRQLKYWTEFIENNCKSLCVTGKPDVIFIGSHIDMEVDQQLAKSEIGELMERGNYCVEFIEYPILLDCRKSNSADLELLKVKKKLLKCTETLIERADLDNRCHLIFSYLYEHFPDKPVAFNDLHRILREQKPTGFQASDHDLPLMSKYLMKLLKDMHSRQHILLIGNDQEDFWILTAKARNEMFKKVFGCLFNSNYQGKILSNVVVLSSEILKETFPDMDYSMLHRFLVHSDLCRKIKDKDLLKLIECGTIVHSDSEIEGMEISKKHCTKSDLTTSDSDDQCSCVEYFFFPGLVKQEKDLNIHNSALYSYSCAWCLSCEQDSSFTPGFLQTLLLRLTFKFAATTGPETKLNRKCIIWTNGLFWSSMGVEIVVEVIDQNQTTLLFLRCVKDPNSELKAIELRSAILKEIGDVKEKCCPATKVREFVFSRPTLDEKGSLVILGKSVQKVVLKDLVSAITSGEQYTEDTSSQYVSICSRDLLYFESYAEIDHNIMFSSLFDPDKEHDTVSEDNLSRLFEATHDHDHPQLIAEFKQLVSQMRRPVVYQNLRYLFDKYSIFHGRDPKVLSIIIYSCIIIITYCDN